MAQICFQANLCLCYITTIVSLLSNSCTIIISIFLFLSLSAFTFLLVESLIILHKLVDRIMMERLERSVFVVVCGYLPALAYSLLTLPWVSQELFPSPDHQAGSVDTENSILPNVLSTCISRCSLNLSSPSSHLLTTPVVLMTVSSLSILVASVVLADDSGRRPISAEVFSRAK